MTLRRIRRGEVVAAEDLVPQLYEELKALAAARVRKLPPGQTLEATALVHETYLRIVGDEDPGWEGRRHFFGSAAKAMRHLMIDELRRKHAAKRGGGAAKLPLAESRISGPPADYEALALQEALEELERLDERKARVVELRFFTGLTIDAVAELLEVSTTTVENDWRFARTWIAKRLRDGS